MALTQTQVSQLYVSTFGRASEGEGNTYWQTDQADMVTTANVMLDTTEAKNYFGATLDSNQDFIEHIYLNTLGKTYAEDTAGVDYWVSELAAGKSKGEVITALINAAQDNANSGDAQDQFNNKVAVSNYTADTLEKFTSTAAFTAFIDDVDETAASVTAAKTSVDDAVPDEDGVEDDAEEIQGGTYQLTDSNVGQGTADNVLGTAGNDTISGATGTLESVDVVNGAAGDDVLTARMDGTGGVAPVISNVETINLISRGGGSLNFADITGFQTVTLTGTSSYSLNGLPNNFEVTLTDIDDEVMTLALDNDSGSADDLTVNLDGTAGTAALVNADDLETVSINSTGDAASNLGLNLTGFDVTNGKITVGGDQDLTLILPNNGGNGTNGTYSDVALDASGFDKSMTILQADTDALDAKNFTGVDVYAFNSKYGTSFSIDNAEADAAVSASLKTDRATLTVDYDQKDAEKISSKTNSLAVTVKTTDTADADDFTVNLTTNEIETVTVTADGATDADSTLTLNFTDAEIESLTIDGDSLAAIDSVTVGGTAFAASELTNFDATASAADVIISLTSNAFTIADTVEFGTGSGDDNIDYNGGGTAIIETAGGDDTIDITGATAGEIEAGAGDDAITGSTGVDDIEGGAGDDTINGAAGADTITGGTGQDTMTGGNTASDVFVIGEEDSGVTTASADIITDFLTAANANNDTLNLDTAATATNFLAVDATTSAFDDIATVELAVTAATASFNGTIQYVYVHDSAGGAGNEAYLVADNDLDGTADFAVELTGLGGNAVGVVVADIV